PTPSQDDIQSTKRIMEVSKLVGIRLLDHLIIGDGRYISLRNEGYME
ncbi:JAB domain-containing protein, partial [Mogibacterium sp.]